MDQPLAAGDAHGDDAKQRDTHGGDQQAGESRRKRGPGLRAEDHGKDQIARSEEQPEEHGADQCQLADSQFLVHTRSSCMMCFVFCMT